MIRQGQTVYLPLLTNSGALVHAVFVASNAVRDQLNITRSITRVYTSKRKAAFDVRMYNDMQNNANRTKEVLV